jgi:hypothetical protein
MSMRNRVARKQEGHHTHRRLAGIPVDALTDNEVRLLIFDELQSRSQVADLLLDRGRLVIVVHVPDTVDVEADARVPPRLEAVQDPVGVLLRRVHECALRLAHLAHQVVAPRVDGLGVSSDTTQSVAARAVAPSRGLCRTAAVADTHVKVDLGCRVGHLVCDTHLQVSTTLI